MPAESVTFGRYVGNTKKWPGTRVWPAPTPLPPAAAVILRARSGRSRPTARSARAAALTRFRRRCPLLLPAGSLLEPTGLRRRSLGLGDSRRLSPSPLALSVHLRRRRQTDLVPAAARRTSSSGLSAYADAWQEALPATLSSALFGRLDGGLWELLDRSRLDCLLIHSPGQVPSPRPLLQAAASAPPGATAASTFRRHFSFRSLRLKRHCLGSGRDFFGFFRLWLVAFANPAILGLR